MEKVVVVKVKEELVQD
jgi:hypothetical protein